MEEKKESIYGKVYDFSMLDEARKLVRTEVIASDYLAELSMNPSHCRHYHLKGIVLFSINPFRLVDENGNECDCQFIRELLAGKDIELMTYCQLAEWLGRGFGEYIGKSGFNYTGHAYSEGCKDEPVPESMRIRRWGTEIPSPPYLRIYEKDCKGTSRRRRRKD